MAKVNKSKTEESAQVVSTPVVVKAEKAPKVAKAPKEAAATKAPKEKEAVVKAVKEPKTPKKAAAPVGATETAPVDAAADASAAPADVVDQSLAEFVSKIQQLSSMVSTLKADFRVLEKKWTRDLKVAQKQSSKRKRKTGTRSPSGFVKPTRISDELATFLEKPAGTEMARTDVTREINTYIRSNNLQDKENGRKINADTKLAKLLKLGKADELTYFNLQKYMSPHFAKAVKAEVVATA
jgi:chromatin remodeling complex protein RSC6